MAQQKIQLRKIRDFGENFSDTFQFIRQEFKPLLTAFILVAGIFILATSILGGLFQKQMFGFLDQIKSGGSALQQNVTSILTPGYFGFLVVTLLSMAAMQTVIVVYMKHYDEHGESPTVKQVWSSFAKYFFKVFLFSIPQLLLMGVALLLCILPVFYAATVLVPLPFVIVNENGSFSRCLDLIKDNFWISFATYLVAYIIYSFSSSIVGIIIGAVVGLGSYFSKNDLSSTAAIFTSVLSIVQYIFYIVFFVSAGLHYYNLVEIKDGTGLEKRIEGLGTGNNSNTTIEEQY